MPAAHLDRKRARDSEKDSLARPAGREASRLSKGLFGRGLWGPPETEGTDLASEADKGPAAAAPPVPMGTSVWSSRSLSTRQNISLKPFRGRYVQALPLTGGPLCDLAWDAIIKTASHHQRDRRQRAGLAVAIAPQDLRQKRRLQKPGRLLLFLVDISGSMGGKYMDLAKKTALILLEHAYIKRDHIAMLAFRGRAAALLVPPTNRAERVQQVMATLLCGGLTPLTAGLELAQHTLSKSRRGNPGLERVMVLISDGQANVGSAPGCLSMEAEIKARARALLREPQLRILFMDTTEAGKVDYSARRLSSLLAAERFVLSHLLRSGLDPAVEIARAIQ